MATTLYVDNVLGTDAAYPTGGTVGAPWKTLAYASATANYGAATTPWTINIVNNGWDNPYLENTVANGIIAPDFSGSDGSPVTWNCNFAPMIPATEITGLTWARLPGTANVYYASFSTANTGIYAWTADLTDDLMLFNGKHYLMPPLEAVTHIPNDWEDHCYYHNTTANILYWCDKSGSPSVTNVKFAYRSTSIACFSPGSSRQYHVFNNPHFYGGRGAGSLGGCTYLTSITTATSLYNQFVKGYLLYNYGGALADFGNGDVIQQCILAYTPGTALGTYAIRIAGNAGYGATIYTHFKNCVIWGSPNDNSTTCDGAAIWLKTDAQLKVQNTAFIDCIKPYQAEGANSFVEDHNFYGLSRHGGINKATVTGQVDVSEFTPDATDVVVTGDTGYSIAAYKETNLAQLNLRPMAGSGVIDVGTDLSLTTDIDGNTIPKGLAADIGAYEIAYGKGRLSIELNISI